MLWPAPEALPYEQLPFDLETATERAALLDLLSRPLPSEPGPILVTPAHGLMQIVMPPDCFELRFGCCESATGYPRRTFCGGLPNTDTKRRRSFRSPARVARRGSILDLFPPGADFPVRIDFFGDEIDAIRSFDPHTQRSHDRLREIRLLPPAELPLERCEKAADELNRLNLDGLRPEVRAEWARTVEMLESGQTPAFPGPLRGIPRRPADDAYGLSHRG